MAAMVSELIPDTLVDFLRIVGWYAERMEIEAYLVGGSVRDWLIGIPAFDIDLMVVGDAPRFTSSLYAEWEELFPGVSRPLPPKIFPKFGTVKISLVTEIAPGVSQFDFASSREEQYAAPGAEPTVTLGASFEKDMLRRDFTANALALEIGPVRFLQVRDAVDGVRDLQNNELRLIHDRSLQDDPARIIRGLRFVARRGFVFEKETERLMKEAVIGRYLQRLPQFRLFDELRKALVEAEVCRTISEFYRWGIVSQLLPEAELLSEQQVVGELSKLSAANLCAPEFKWVAALFVLIRDKTKFIELLKRSKLSRVNTASAISAFELLSNAQI